MKRIFAFLMILFMALMLIPVGAAIISDDGYSAEIVQLPGEGTSDNPFTISDVEHLLFFAKQVNSGNVFYRNAHYSLLEDVELSGEWTPIGNMTYPFKGKFNGNGFTVKGMKITASNSFTGFFGYSEGTVQNLTVTDYRINSTCQYSGGITGYNSGNIVNCHSDGSITVRNIDRELGVGGIVGVNFGSVYFCSSTNEDNRTYNITVSSENNGGTNTKRTAQAGGIVGLNFGKVNTCFSHFNVIVNTENPMPGYAAGLVGVNSGGNITECYASGNASVDYYIYPTLYVATAGGLVAHNTGKIVNCFALGDVKTLYGDAMSSQNIGGLVGLNSSGFIDNCFRYKNQKVVLSEGVSTYPLSPGTINDIGEAYDNLVEFYSIQFLVQKLRWNDTNWVRAMQGPPRLLSGDSAIQVYTLDKLYGTGAVVIEYDTLKVLADAESSYNEESGVLKVSRDWYYSVNVPDCTLNSFSRFALVPTSSYSYISAVHCDGADALANEVYLTLGSKEAVKLYVYPSEGVSVKGYELLETDDPIWNSKDYKKIYESENGVFSVVPAKLDDDNTYWVRIIRTDGEETRPLQVNIRVVEALSADDIADKLDLGLDLFAFDIPDNVPLIGGKELKVGTEDLFNIHISKQPDRIMIALGLNNEEKDAYGDFQKAIDDVRNGITSAKAKKYLYSGPDDDDPFEFKIMGYVEMPVNSHGNVHLNGITAQVIVTIAGEWEHQWQCYAFSVPVVIKVNIGASATATLSLQFDPYLNVNVGGAIKIEAPSVTPSLGVGIINAFDVSVYGKAEHTLDWDFETNRVVSTLSGEVGLSATLFSLELEEPLLSGDLVIYDSSLQSRYSLLKSGSLSAYLNIDNYTLNRGYNTSTSAWGDDNGVSLFGYASSNERVLQSSIFHSANPETVKLNDGTLIMVWVTDIADRSDYNHTAIVWSAYDPDTGVWSLPEIIDDDGTADYSPSIVTDGDNVFVAWMDSNICFEGEPDIAYIASSCDISVAKLTFGSQGFGQVLGITSDDCYDASVQLYVIDGNVYALWLKNSENDVTMLKGETTLMTASLSDLNTVTTVAVSDSPILDFAMGMYDGEVSVAYTVDADANLVTEGNKLYLKSLLSSDEILLDDGAIYDLTPVSYKNSNGFFAYKDGEIVFYNADYEAISVMELYGARDYIIVETAEGLALVYVSTESSFENGNAAYVVFFDGELWSLPVLLTEGEGYIDDLSVYVDADGNFNIVYTKTIAELVDGKIERITSLCTNTLTSGSNLTLNGAFVGKVSSDGNVAVEAIIVNNGFKPFDGYKISVLNKSGSVVYEGVVNEIIGIGEEKIIDFSMPIPSVYSAETFTVIVMPIGGSDTLPADNRAAITLGESDLSVSATRITTGNSSGTVVTVRNNGIREEYVTLNLRKETEDGDILTKFILGSLKPGETADYVLDASRFRPFFDECTLFVIEVCGSTVDAYANDNFCNIVIEQKTVNAGDGREIPVYCDINSDGEINVLDVIQLKKIIDKNTETDSVYKYDLNGDKLLNDEDAVFLAGVVVQ